MKKEEIEIIILLITNKIENERKNLKYAKEILEKSLTLSESLRATKEIENIKGKIEAFKETIEILEI